jgi:dipeptidyl aminopeptidase/acylaminoacyl peptidase
MTQGLRGKHLLGRSGLASSVLVVSLAIGAITAGQARAAFPGTNGKIVFETNRDGNEEIYTMNSDGTNRLDLTRDPADDTDPRWSADGSRIVFASNRPGNFQIYTMNADGSGVTRVTHDANDDRRPTWTADGHILFQNGTFPNRAIFRINADGNGLQQLTPVSSDNATVAAAPRGGRIAFSSTRGDGTQRLYTANADGSEAQLVLPSPPGPETADVEADWSPRGNQLLFVRFTFGGPLNSDLYVVRSDGSGLRQLTNTPGRLETQPAWSPDGTKISFFAATAIGTPDEHDALYTMNSDGSGVTEISTPRIPYLDTFDGDRIDPFWFGPTIIGSGPSVVQTNGRLEVSIPSATLNDPGTGFTDAGVSTQCLLLGDYDVQVDYQLLQWPPQSGVNVDFNTNTIVNGSFDQTFGLFVFDPGGGTGVSTNFPGPTNKFVPAPETAGTLRFVRIGPMLTAYRLTPAGWNAIQSTSELANEVGVSLDLFSNAPQFSHPDVKVAYDNFRINSGTFSCPSWWRDNASNWQPLP